METKQIVMLSILLGSGALGSAILVYVLSHLDKNEEEAEAEKHDAADHGH